jgi:hypothetical protein
MKVLDIKEITRKDMPIYYRMFFSAKAVLQILEGEVERNIDFSIEIKPTGHKEIVVTLAEPVDYPLIPVISALKTAIEDLHFDGKLPL